MKKSSLTPFILTPIALAIAGTLLTSQAAMATAPTAPAPAVQTSRVHEAISTQSGRDISPADEAVISSSANRVLRHIALAREALHRKDADAAKQNLRQADVLLSIIENTVPTTLVKDRIWTADNKLQYENSEEIGPSDVPIYATLEEQADFDPVKLPGAGRTQGQDQAKSNRIAKAKAAAGRTELEADDAALYYEEMDLPLDATRHFVAAAQTDLGRNQLMEADQNLRAAQDGVEFVSVYVPEPLVSARLNLQRAHEHFAAGQVADAKADVGRAIKQLTRVEQEAGPETRSNVQKLLSDAQSLQSRIDQGGPGVMGELKGLWRHTEALADRAVEYTETGWSRLRHQHKLRGDLIEAKRYVAYADIDANEGKDPAKSLEDLRQANSYLDKASAAAVGKSDLEVYIKDAKATVETILSGKAKGDPGEMANLKSQLGQAIGKL